MRWRARIGTVGSAVLVAASSIAILQGSSGASTVSQLTRYPYLTDLVGNSVDVNWATNTSASTASASWGAVDASGNCTVTSSVGAARTSITVNNVAEYQWAATLSLPGPGSYCYRVFLNGTDLLGSDPSPKFTTQVPAGSGQPFSFAVIGDWGSLNNASGNPDESNVLTQLASSGARFAMTVGDNSYPSGSQTNYGDLNQTGSNISAVFGPPYWTVPGRSIPIFPATGNHGISSTTSTRSTEQVNFSERVAASSSGGMYQEQTYCCVNGTRSASYPSTWYAFTAGNARFYVLSADWANSNVGSGTLYSDDYAAHWTTSSPEYQWLRSDLASHQGGLKFAFFHFPIYSDQPGQSSDTFLQGPNSLEGLLAANNVSLTFSGHAHAYERNAPTGPGTFPSYVTGGGGATLQGVSGCSGFDAYAIGWGSSGSQCGSAPVPDSATRVFHFLKVTVNGGQVTVTPTDELGRTFDVQTYNFANGSAGSPPSTLIDSGPSGLTSSPNATFVFHSTASGATFRCQLDGSPLSACTSPVTYNGLADGTHTFKVESATAAGTDPSPPTATWTVDTIAPSAPGALSATAVSSSQVNLSWTGSTDANGIASYTIVRNGSTLASVGGSSLTYSDTSVVGGTQYQYHVVAVDPAGNPSAASNTASVTTPPGTSTTTTVNLTPSQAAYVFASSSTTNFGSTDPLDLSFTSYRTLLEFNTSAIPAGATINSVSLAVTPALTESSGGVEVHPEASGWSQSTVTWSNQPAWNTTILNTSGIPTAGSALSINLPVSAITAGGLSDLGLRFTASGIIFKIFGASDTAHPVLRVTYTTG